ncbi:hypothetical protein ACQYAD_09250 [Neobacillus sp. SM06]
MQKRTVSRKFKREQSAPKTNEQTYTMTEMFENSHGTVLFESAFIIWF